MSSEPPVPSEPAEDTERGADVEGGSDVVVDVDEALRANRVNWDDRAVLHATSSLYDLAGFVADPHRISNVTRDDLTLLEPHLPGGSVAGLDVVHLQCHVGEDTLSLARLGARVTGVDLSPRSLEIARDLAERCGLAARFVEADVTHAADVVREDFDVVFTSIGTVTWLPDLPAWADSIAHLLRPGGTFFIRDGHPMLYTLDDARSDLLAVRYRYFATDHAETWQDEVSYSGDGPIEHPRTYEWPHALSEIIGALLGAGLRVTSFGEQQALPWQAHPLMVQEGRSWVLPERWRDLVPLAYSITAVRDG